MNAGYNTKEGSGRGTEPGGLPFTDYGEASADVEAVIPQKGYIIGHRTIARSVRVH